MKNLIALILVLSFCQTSFAGVKEDVLALGKLAMGFDSHSVKGRTAEKLFTNFLTKEYGEADELVFKEIDEMDYGDEVDEGFTSLASAKAMSGFAESALEEKMEGLDGSELAQAKKEFALLKKNWGKLIEKLSKQGVKFGYTGNGPGYCGVSFVELIIVDVEGQTVYTVYLSESGEC